MAPFLRLQPSSPLRGSHSRSRPHTWPFSKASSPHPEPVHPLLPEATARVRTSSSPGPSMAETSHLVSWPLLNDLNSAHTRGDLLISGVNHTTVPPSPPGLLSAQGPGPSPLLYPHLPAPPQCSSPTGLPLHLPWLCPAPAPGPSHVLSLSPARTICWNGAEAASFGRDLYPPLPYRCTTPIHHHTYDVIFSEATCKPLGAQRPRLTRQLGRARHRRRSNLPRSGSDMEPQPGFLTPLLPYQADAQVGKLRPREEAVPGKQAGRVPHRDQKSNKISRPGQRSPRWTLVTLPLGRKGREHADLSPEQPVLSPRGSC
ncbi:uncharacterized protein LOC115831282 isoform X1 [Nomascus leucogenys]|uniref:uncharacterized protein LOC115831282 isoform X1 n=1 Tax=Nomascus leucogenys TaxID=61853 RepID=UPI00122DAAAD|nr:uncharacterized protein LOC115831282 isoform X1 [Nomascus leucogenys]